MGIKLNGALNTGTNGIELESVNANTDPMITDGSGAGILVTGDINSEGLGIRVNGDI